MGDSRNIRVAVRVRPFNRRELEQNQRNIIKVLDKTTLMFDPDEDEDEFFFHGMKQTHRDITKRVKKKLAMEYDDVFDAEANNEIVFQHCTKPLVQSVMDGYNCSVFVYGATGAGKTFTMLGSEEFPGITFLTMEELFRQIDALSAVRKFDIGISYLEVYNELVMNLLTKSGPLKLREDASGVVVSGLVLKQIHNARELLDLLALGNQNRTQHPTDANAESSRSHAIFQVHIRMVDKTSGQKKTVKLSMIDLAGSERAASTKGIGIRFKEGANINKSLLALGNCINKLADGLKHIPYRDSNLTRILKDSLGGNCQTLMIANVSPSSLTYEDTYNTLKYASRAKKIRTTLKQNIVPSNVPKDYLIKKVNEQAEEIERLKAKLKSLEEQKSEITAPIVGYGLPDETLLNTWRSRIENCYAIANTSQEHYFNLQSKEKILNLRSKLKEQAEAIKKIVTLDGKHLNLNIARLQASIDRYSKQITQQREEMHRWAKRYKAAIKSIATLKAEVNSTPLVGFLKYQLEAKDAELNEAKSHHKKSHVMKINMIYVDENKQWEKITTLSADIIQQNYLLLRSMGRLDNIILEKMEKLVRLDQCQRGVKFSEDDDQSELMKEVNITDTSIEKITNLSDCVDTLDWNGEMETECALKRLKSDDESESETVSKMQTDEPNVVEFKKPKALRPLNFKAQSLSVKTTVTRKTPTKSQKTTTIAQFKVPKLLVSGSTKMSCAKKLQKFSSSSSSTDTSDLSDGPDEGTANGNNTFCIDSSKDSASSLFSNVLVESNVDPKVLNKVLRRASTKGNVISKVTLTLNKENRKFSPKRVGKSPRPLTRTNSRSHTTATSLINRYRMMKAGAIAGPSSTAGPSSGGLKSAYNSDNERKRAQPMKK
ncbi:kinesin-like protein KIF18A [Toxorhynchites rutilus septentrionalis]|uniref:kinesin-like protein KIF18A n=1 Tax=Toxorhynchites rutilus septentrionalis TaxID=329112 RepID=UPI0024788D02|nr:kinesin-like protein KIF18A [Toxorhynchites rutilus septentrionalis]